MGAKIWQSAIVQSPVFIVLWLVNLFWGTSSAVHVTVGTVIAYIVCVLGRAFYVSAKANR